MSLKVKLISLISLFILMLGTVIIGVLAASSQTLTMTGSVQFNVGDKSLYVKDVKIQQDSSGELINIPEFEPGYINGNFDMDIGDFNTENNNANNHGSFRLYFYIINTTDSAYYAEVELSETLVNQGVSATASGEITPTTIAEVNGNIVIDETTEHNGIVTLTIIAPNSYNIDLNDILITIEESFPIQITSIFSTGETEDTYSSLIGGIDSIETIDLSNISFNPGETELTISMTSQSENYIKSIVSYDSGSVTYNQTGENNTIFVHATSLYLPQNPSGELTRGEKRELKIYVNNNTNTATTISGLQVSFEEKTTLLQADETNQYWYVEMGTIMGQTSSEYIRWKYIASVEDSTGNDNPTRATSFDINTPPTGKGYFYLETDVLTAIGRDGTCDMIEVSLNNDWTRTASQAGHQNRIGWENVLANDYATSSLRQYINGVDTFDGYETPEGMDTFPYPYEPAGRLSNMYKDLNIDEENDLIYNQIITRSLGDLYAKNYADTDGLDVNGNGISFPDLSGGEEGYRYTSDDENKFWLLSYYEVYWLTGGSTTSGEDSGRMWPSTSPNFYWLRSPGHTHTDSAFSVSATNGEITSNRVSNATYAARSAFKLEI